MKPGATIVSQKYNPVADYLAFGTNAEYADDSDFHLGGSPM